MPWMNHHPIHVWSVHRHKYHMYCSTTSSKSLYRIRYMGIEIESEWKLQWNVSIRSAFVLMSNDCGEILKWLLELVLYRLILLTWSWSMSLERLSGRGSYINPPKAQTTRTRDWATGWFCTTTQLKRALQTLYFVSEGPKGVVCYETETYLFCTFSIGWLYVIKVICVLIVSVNVHFGILPLLRLCQNGYDQHESAGHVQNAPFAKMAQSCRQRNALNVRSWACKAPMSFEMLDIWGVQLSYKVTPW